MEVLRAVLTMVGLLVVLLLAAAVVGLAVAILAIMVTGALEEDRRPLRVPVPPRRTVPANRAMDTIRMAQRESPAIPERATSRAAIPVMAASLPARGTARADQRNKG